MPDCHVSVILCTQDRAEHLRQTLAAMARVRVPDGLTTELIVVDNASTDHTAQVIQSCRLPDMPVRYVSESRRGLSHARNTGVAEATGEIVVFTDDDIRPQPQWLECLSEPIARGEAAAVGGAVTLAPHLLRPWMAPLHRQWLAETDASREAGFHLVGANMAFSRAVLARVPHFDTDLGAGAMGTLEDHLFSAQLRKAGYRLAVAPQAVVEHHFDETRLSRASMVRLAKARGASFAYIAYHWQHQDIPDAATAFLRAALRLSYRRLRNQRLRRPHYCPEWEFEMITDVAFLRQSRIESRKSRHYEKYGLVRLS